MVRQSMEKFGAMVNHILVLQQPAATALWFNISPCFSASYESNVGSTLSCILVQPSDTTSNII